MICADNTGMPIWDLTTGKETRRFTPQVGSPAQVACAPNAFCLSPSAFCLPPSAFRSDGLLAVARGQIYPDPSGTVAL